MPADRITTALDALNAAVTDTLAEAEAKRLEALGDAQQAAGEMNRLRDANTALQAALASALAAGLPLWGSEPPQAGRTYRVPPGPLAIAVTVPGITLLATPGGTNWPGETFGIAVKADDCSLIGFSFDVPNPPGSTRIGVKPCVRTTAKRATLLACGVNNVDTFAEIMPGSEDVLVARCNGLAGLRGGFVYAAGAKRLTITHCTALDSWGENVVRFSPELAAVTEGAVVAFSDFANPGTGKNVIDARHARGVTIQSCKIRQVNGGPAVRLGDSDAPGLSGLRLVDCDVYGGQVYAKPLASGSIDNVRFWGLDPSKDVPLNIDGTGPIVPTNCVAYYTGTFPQRPKPASTVGGCEWRAVPAVTVPGGAGQP